MSESGLCVDSKLRETCFACGSHINVLHRINVCFLIGAMPYILTPMNIF